MDDIRTGRKGLREQSFVSAGSSHYQVPAILRELDPGNLPNYEFI